MAETTRKDEDFCYHEALTLDRHVPYWSQYSCNNCKKKIVIESNKVFEN